MATVLKYLWNKNCHTLKARVVSAKLIESELTSTQEGQRVIIETDATCFYPSGGGQLHDIGSISTADWKCIIHNVTKCKDSGKVFHEGVISWDDKHVHDTNFMFEINTGSEVQLQIDVDRRNLHNRLHTAGHILDIVLLDELGYGNDLSVMKAMHYPGKSSVEYRGRIENITGNSAQNRRNKELLIEDIQRKCSEIIRGSGRVRIEALHGDPDDFGKTTRVMWIEGYRREILCGGTHCQNVDEVQSMIIRKLECKGNVLRVAYDVQ